MTSKKFIDYAWDNELHKTPGILKDLVKILSNVRNLQKLSYIDVGCGNGAITKILAKFFKNTCGIDLSLDGIRLAKKNNISKIEFLHKDMDTLIKKKKYFDFVSAIEVIEHQYDPHLFISQLNLITKKNGYILISTPYHGYLKNLLISLLGMMDNHFTALWRHGHIKFFSLKTLKNLVLTKNIRIGNRSYQNNLSIINVSFSGRFFPFSRSMIFLLKKN